MSERKRLLIWALVSAFVAICVVTLGISLVDSFFLGLDCEIKYGVSNKCYDVDVLRTVQNSFLYILLPGLFVGGIVLLDYNDYFRGIWPGVRGLMWIATVVGVMALIWLSVADSITLPLLVLVICLAVLIDRTQAMRARRKV